MSGDNQVVSRKSAFNKFLDFIEVLGNKLPDPSLLFIWFCALILVLSWIGAKFGWTAVHPGTGKEITVFNLLSAEGIQYMFSSVVVNVTKFAPFGIAIVIMTSVGLLDNSGLLRATFVNMGLKVNKRALTFMIVFLGIMANFASDIGFIVMPPLAAMLFLAADRHPIVGMCCAYASCSCGLAANLLVSVGDATVTGISISAARILDPTFSMSPACNWYLFATAVIVLTPVAVIVTEKVIEPRVGKWVENDYAPKYNVDSYRLSPVESRALRMTGIFVLLMIAVFALAVSPWWGILRNPDGVPIYVYRKTQLPSIVATITIFMALPAIFYGRLVGTIVNGQQFGKACTKGLIAIAPFILICVIAGQFIAYFGKSNLGIICAVKGANILKNMNIGALPLFLLLIIFFMIINLLIASSSAKWTLLAPIFVPMFMLLNYNPAVVQAAYRIGDSTTNAITPLLAYFAILIGYAQQYDENAGIGTLMSMLVPYTIFFGLTWLVFFSIWFLTGLPFGPGSAILLH